MCKLRRWVQDRCHLQLPEKNRKMSSSQAELLKRKREARKQKILSNSKDRLDQITQSYTANNPDLDDDKDFASEIASLPASSAAKDDGDESIHEVLDKAPSATAKPSATDDVDDGDQKEVMPKISSTPNRLQQNSTPLFVQEAELPPYDPLSTYDPNDTTSPAPSLQFSDTLSWLHAILLSLLISYSLINWILNHTHDMFSLGSLVQDLAHKRICRQLYFMAYNPVHEDLGASSIISFLGYSSPGEFDYFQILKSTNIF